MLRMQIRLLSGLLLRDPFPSSTLGSFYSHILSKAEITTCSASQGRGLCSRPSTFLTRSLALGGEVSQ